MTKIRTHYDNLGVARTAPPEVIKASYKALAQKYHPDKNPDNPDAERIFKIIVKAYTVLSNPSTRAEHDSWIEEQEAKNQQSQNHSYAGAGSHRQTTQSQQQNRHDGHQNTRQNTHQNTQRRQSASNVFQPAKPPSTDRITRTKYALLFLILSIVAGFVVNVLSSSMMYSMPSQGMIVMFCVVATLAHAPLIFFIVQRLHDCDYNGWWALVPLAPLVAFFVPGTKGQNRFGADPREKNRHLNSPDMPIKKDGAFVGSMICLFFINFTFLSAILSGYSAVESVNLASSEQSSTYPSPTVSTPDYDVQPAPMPNMDTDTSAQMLSQRYQSVDTAQLLALAKTDYENAVANINAVWDNLHPTTRDYLRVEQRTINSNREAYCKHQGEQFDTDSNIQKAYRYACEVPQLNERAEYLKTQMGVKHYPNVPLPSTGASNNPYLTGNSPLEIKTATGGHYWVKIIDAYSEDELVSYFIRGGDTLDTELPSGNYLIRYATGNTWHGEDYLFGDDTSYVQANEVFYFEDYSGYTLELIRQVNGNLGTVNIDAENF